MITSSHNITYFTNLKYNPFSFWYLLNWMNQFLRQYYDFLRKQRCLSFLDETHAPSFPCLSPAFSIPVTYCFLELSVISHTPTVIRESTSGTLLISGLAELLCYMLSLYSFVNLRSLYLLTTLRARVCSSIGVLHVVHRCILNENASRAIFNFLCIRAFS